MYYTYLWLREDGTPYYVGKGSSNRAFKGNRHKVPAPYSRKLILVEEFSSEQDAFVAEIFLIAYYGRRDLGTGCLRNLTDGGEGISGHIMLESSRRKMSLGRRGRTKSESHRKLIGLAHKGRVFSEETISRMSTAQKSRTSGRVRSETDKKRMHDRLMGHVTSEETKRKISNTLKGRKTTPEQRRRQSEAQTGKKRGPYKKRGL